VPVRVERVSVRKCILGNRDGKVPPAWQRVKEKSRGKARRDKKLEERLGIRSENPGEKTFNACQFGKSGKFAEEKAAPSEGSGRHRVRERSGLHPRKKQIGCTTTKKSWHSKSTEGVQRRLSGT